MTVATNTSVREDAVAALAAMLTAMNQAQADSFGNTYQVQFSVDQVWRSAPSDLGKGKLGVGVILEHTETKKELISTKVDCQLTVTVEAHVQRQGGQDPQVVINLWLSEIERCLRSDRTLGGNCWNTEFVQNDVAIEGPYKDYFSGALRMVLYYRHSAFDPRQRL